MEFRYKFVQFRGKTKVIYDFSDINCNASLLRMGYKSLDSYFKSWLWTFVKSHTLTVKRHTCCICENSGSHIHFWNFEEKTLLGNDLKSISLLCETCLKKLDSSVKVKTLEEYNRQLLIGLGPTKKKHQNVYCSECHQYIKVYRELTEYEFAASLNAAWVCDECNQSHFNIFPY